MTNSLFDRIINTCLIVAGVMLAAVWLSCAVGCSSEPPDTIVPIAHVPAGGDIMVNGQMHRRVSGGREAVEAAVMAQAHDVSDDEVAGMFPGRGRSDRDDIRYEALKMARNQRSVSYLDGAQYLGPELPSRPYIHVAEHQLRLRKDKANRAEEEELPPRKIIFGSDNRDWPGFFLPSGSLATLAVFTRGAVTGGQVVQPQPWGVHSGSGVMVNATGGQSIGITAAHITMPAGYPQQGTPNGVLQVPETVMVLPHQGVPYGGPGQEATCNPLVAMPWGWVGSWGSDRAYDIAVMNWSAAGCPAEDRAKHAWTIPMVNFPYSYVPVGPCTPFNEWIWAQNWGMPGPLESIGCGPHPTVGWPTTCGMQGWTFRCPSGPYLYSTHIDIEKGHSGGPYFTTTVPAQLVGILSHSLQYLWSWTTHATTRNVWTNGFLTSNGVQ